MTEPWPTPAASPAASDAAPPAPPAAPAAVPPTTPTAVHPAAGPFDPPGVTWQPVSPKLVTVRLISLALSFGLPLVASAVVAALTGVPGLWAVPAVLGVLGAWLAILVPRQVRGRPPPRATTTC